MFKIKPLNVLSFLWWSGIGVTLLGLLWLSWSYALSIYFLEQGSRSLARGEVKPAITNILTALNFEPTNVLASRRLAQAYLRLNQTDKALAAAQQTAASAPDNPLVQLELGDIYDLLGEAEQAVAHYEAGQVSARRPQLIANYLQLAERLWNSGEQARAVTIWQTEILPLDSGNLYANWRLAQYYASDAETVAPFRDRVSYFRLNGILAPLDRRLEEYQAQAFIGAVAEGLWSRETLLKVIAYRVWQDQSQSTENLLQTLLVEFPGDADLHFYLGEMYHRRGDAEQAQITYRHVLDVDQHYALAYLRLGMIAEASCGQQAASCMGLERAEEWYDRYHQLAPDDPVGLQKLVKVYEILGRPEAARLQAQLEAKTNKQRLVAESLHLGLDEFELGQNLLKEMQFQNGQLVRDENWQWDAWRGPTSDQALFVEGQDNLDEEGVIRTITLWQRPVPEGSGLFYADYGQNVTLEANSFYVLSFDYKTNDFEQGTAFVALLEFVLQPRFVFVHKELLDTTNSWQKWVLVGQSYQEPIEVRLLLRNWGIGDVSFDQVELRQIKFSGKSN